nr:UDP-glycosyltransferase 91A1-like [Tanacetum cinerariifolium]
MAENSNGNLHIAMLPWLAFGHIINLPKVENLPENAEATKDIPLDTIKYLKIACDRLQQPIADFLKASSPDWIICDFHTHWLGPLAAEHGMCGLPFYWVLIDQRGSSDDEVIELPYGFEERTCGRGIVCRSWAPQFKILSHDLVGGLLIHSGMSSVVEGLQLGKPLVLLPLLMDQGLIASYLVEKRMAYKVHRNHLDGSFEPKSVADSLCLVMVKEEDSRPGNKDKEMMSLFQSSHSVTGGVYKARERIHRRMADRRLLAIPASCRRAAACNK